MQSRISIRFGQLKEKGKKALIGYLTCGYPDMDTTMQLVTKAQEAGVDIMELGIPYSDPVADGPVIQMASETALQNGVNIDMIFGMVKELRKSTEIPLVIMAYYNSVFRYGNEKFISGCKDAGVDGLIVPDLPYEERGILAGFADEAGIDLIPLVAPTSEDRIKTIASKAKGFVYCVSTMGVTGRRSALSEELGTFMEKVRENTDLPLAIGFGISGAEAAANVKGLCDGVIVGSAIIEKIGEGEAKGDSLSEVIPFIRELKSALE